VTLRAPFPWFGGKSRVAHIVWPRLGDVGIMSSLLLEASRSCSLAQLMRASRLSTMRMPTSQTSGDRWPARKLILTLSPSTLILASQRSRSPCSAPLASRDCSRSS
jgi:hypothetical protein